MLHYYCGTNMLYTRCFELYTIATLVCDEDIRGGEKCFLGYMAPAAPPGSRGFEVATFEYLRL